MFQKETYASLVPPRLLRQLFRVLLFIGLVVLFRQLLVLLVFFVAFERPMGIASEWLARRGWMKRRLAVALLALTILGALGTSLALGVGRAIREGALLREELPARIAAFRETDLFHRVEPHIHGADRLVEGAQHYAGEAVHVAAEFGHILLFALIGFILATVFLIERDELVHFTREQDPDSLPGTLLRWLHHLADAVSVTLQFQIIVAACNAVLTFPVLLIAGIPHATAFLFMIFFSGMVPVVGNFVAGAVLTILAYQAHGWLGVGIFVGLTFVLHKLESYYLNPRLASRHVHLPGFVLIVSLLLWEHLLGFVGLFVSFPFLFVAARIRAEFVEEEVRLKAAA